MTIFYRNHLFENVWKQSFLPMLHVPKNLHEKGEVIIQDASDVVRKVRLNGIPSPTLLSNLSQENYRMIISLVEEWELFPAYKSYDSYEQEVARRGLTLLRIPTPPGLPPDPHDSIRAYAVMDVHLSQGSRVYVHCKNGEERSPLFLTGYLLYKGYGIEGSLSVVKKLAPKFVISKEHYTFLSLLDEALYGLEKKR